MDSVAGLDLPAHHALLERAVNYFQGDDRVLGMILGGSLALGTADSYSDVDLYIVARDQSFEALFDERDLAARAIGTPLFRFAVDPVAGGSRDYIVTYPDPIKLDLMYYRESEVLPGPKWIGCPVLKDTTGLVADVLARSQDLPPPPEPEVLLCLNQKFWTWCWYVFGKIMRGELWEALNGMHTIRSDALLLLLDWTTGGPHVGYRRLERKLDPEMAERLAATVAPLESEALHNALQAAIVLFCDLREPISDAWGLTFDRASEEVVRGEMSRHWAER